MLKNFKTTQVLVGNSDIGVTKCESSSRDVSGILIYLGFGILFLKCEIWRIQGEKVNSTALSLLISICGSTGGLLVFDLLLVTYVWLTHHSSLIQVIHIIRTFMKIYFFKLNFNGIDKPNWIDKCKRIEMNSIFNSIIYFIKQCSCIYHFNWSKIQIAPNNYSITSVNKRWQH